MTNKKVFLPGDICMSNRTTSVWNSLALEINNRPKFIINADDIFLIISKSSMIDGFNTYLVLTKFGLGWIDQLDIGDFKNLN